MKKEDDKVTPIKKGKKVTPLFERKWRDDPDIAKYKEEIEKINFSKAMHVCWVSTDSKGHSQSITFRVPPGLARYFSVLISRVPKFKTLTDFVRTAVVLGTKQIKDSIELDEKMEEAINNYFRYLALQNMILEEEIVHSEAKNFILRMKGILEGCSSRKEFEKLHQKFLEQAENCGNEYLQERMFKALELFRFMEKSEK